ncbi:hypothetical protein [Deinococcus sp. UYEF24]
MNRSLLYLLSFLSAVLGVSLSGAALAEGSSELNGTGAADYRAFLETGYGGGTTSGVPRKTLLYAYVVAGEKLALGQSGMGLGVAAIKVNSIDGATTLATFNTASGCGLIGTRAQEVNGPLAARAGGYPQCTYAPAATGIYQIEFLAPSNSGSPDPTPTLTTAQWPAPAAGNSTVAAWDVTVLAGTTAKKGRVYAKYMSLNVGSNGDFINLKVNFLTRDGYQYAVTQKLDPYGYIFFANNKGLTKANGDPSYLSGSQASTFHSPASTDTASDTTAKIFLNTPDTTLPTTSGGEWLRLAAPQIAPAPTGLSFTGRDGTAGYAGSTNGYLTGGTFTFTNPGGGNGDGTFAYRLTIPLSANGTSKDRVILGTAAVGADTVSWDGLDGNGNPVPAGAINYAASVELYGGEIHFPLLDVENSSGLIIQRQAPNPAPTTLDNDPYTVYWDDSAVTVVGTPPSPVSNLGGVSSVPAVHTWSGTYGNVQTIDTWAFYPSSPTVSGNGVVIRSADIRIVKAAVSTGAPRGHATLYTLDVSNLTATTIGPVQVTVTDPLPAWGTALTWTCATGCSPASGNGNLSTVVTLTGTTAVRINVSVVTSNTQTAGASVTNTGASTRAKDAVDPALANNTSSVPLTVRDPVTALSIVKEQRNVTQNGAFAATNMSVKPLDAVQYRLTYTATGDTSFTTFTLRDPLPAQLAPAGNATLTCPNGTTVSVSPAGQLYSINLVTPCGTINPGDTGTLLIPATVR